MEQGSIKATGKPAKGGSAGLQDSLQKRGDPLKVKVQRTPGIGSKTNKKRRRSEINWKSPKSDPFER